MTNTAGGEATWIILRTAGPRTLKLAASLKAAGVEAWTPEHLVRRRQIRSKNRREVAAPIMPTFVFARADHLPAVVAMLALPINPHPPFSIFRHGDRVPVIADGTLANLRAVEARAAMVELKRKRVTFPIGQQVTVSQGAATGMTGVVQSSDGKFAVVAFGSIELKIAAFLLVPAELDAPALAA